MKLSTTQWILGCESIRCSEAVKGVVRPGIGSVLLYRSVRDVTVLAWWRPIRFHSRRIDRLNAAL